jgi:uncharacterized protein
MNRMTRLPAFNLTDTGPIVALVNANDPNHLQAQAALRRLPKRPLLTTWPCFTEAMYLLHRAGGHAAQAVAWDYVIDGLVRLHELTEPDRLRMRTLMAQYADTPMDLADASLIVTAEGMGLRQIFTLDRDFYIYRMFDGSMLEVIT